MLTQIDDDLAHAMMIMTGCESLANQYRTSYGIAPKTYEEIYAAEVLNLNGYKLREIEGAEGFVKNALYKIGSILEAVWQRWYQYVNFLDRILANNILKVSYGVIYNAKTPIEMANASPFTAEQIVRIINDPKKEKQNVDKLVSIVNKSFSFTRDFKIDQEALLPVIKMASENKGNAEKVNKAIKSAGGVSKLLKKHGKQIKDINVDKNAFSKAYDGIVHEREAYMSELEALAARSARILKTGENTVGADWLSTAPTNLKKAFELAKDLAVVRNAYGMPLLRELKTLIAMLEKDIDSLKTLLSKAKHDSSITEKQVNAALDLIRVYSALVEKAVAYEAYSLKLKQNALKVATEALYKVIIESARLENAGA